MVEPTLFSPADEVMWSTDEQASDHSHSATDQVREAVNGTITSNLVKDRLFTGLDGTVIIKDAAETYVPL